MCGTDTSTTRRSGCYAKQPVPQLAAAAAQVGKRHVMITVQVLTLALHPDALPRRFGSLMAELALDAVQTVAVEHPGGQLEVDYKNYAKVRAVVGAASEISLLCSVSCRT